MTDPSQKPEVFVGALEEHVDIYAVEAFPIEYPMNLSVSVPADKPEQEEMIVVRNFEELSAWAETEFSSWDIR